jgi:hypothetical protein
MVMYNVLFASGRVMEFGTLDIATIYATAYNGSILPTVALDSVEDCLYNDSVVIDMEVI